MQFLPRLHTNAGQARFSFSGGANPRQLSLYGTARTCDTVRFCMNSYDSVAGRVLDGVAQRISILLAPIVANPHRQITGRGSHELGEAIHGSICE